MDDASNELISMIGMPEEDRERVGARMDEFLALLKDGKQVELTEVDKAMIEKAAKFALVHTIEIDIAPEEITRETRLFEDLEVDSLAFLQMFDEFQEITRFDVDVNVVAKYAMSHPVATFGELMDQMFDFVEKREAILKELDIDGNMTQPI